MKNISEFFKRIGGVQAKALALRGSIQSAIKEFVGIELPVGDITVKAGIISIKNIPHTAKSTIFIYKKKIIDRANQLQSEQKILDIR